jgi:prolipoprotein diacylglyceryltransferase
MQLNFTPNPNFIYAHWLFESLAYLVGYRLYLRQRQHRGDTISDSNRGWVIAAAFAGAAIGSKLLFWLESPSITINNWHNPFYLMSGKTIVGGLVGGLIAVEWVKRCVGINRRTGDLFAIPLTIGISIGRIGCFLAGLKDNTYGLATSLPWGINFGDGVFRHPTQLYEIVWLLILACWLHWVANRPHREGDLFKTFMVGYFGFRLIVDFIKPGEIFLAITFIQWVCLGILIYYGRDLPFIFRWKEAIDQ